MKRWLLAAIGLAMLACDDEAEVSALQRAPGSIAVLEQGSGVRGTGWWPSLIFDQHDQPHLTYCDADAGKLRYATRVNGAWTVETPIPRGNVGKYTSVTITRDGLPAAVYYNQDEARFKYVERDASGAWHAEAIAWGPEVGMASELFLDGHGRATALYYSPAGRLMQATRTGKGEWSKKVVAEANGGFSVELGLAHGPNGPWITFMDDRLKDTKLFLAAPTGKAQQPYAIEVVDDHRGPGWRSALFLGASTPRVIYTRSFKEQLFEAWRSEQGWARRRIDRRVGNFAAITNPQGQIIVAYQDTTRAKRSGSTLRYMREERPGWWRRLVVDETPHGGHYLDAAVDSRGRLMIVYTAGDIRAVKIYDETGGTTVSVPPATEK